jgi:hypothetical protein
LKQTVCRLRLCLRSPSACSVGARDEILDVLQPFLHLGQHPCLVPLRHHLHCLAGAPATPPLRSPHRTRLHTHIHIPREGSVAHPPPGSADRELLCLPAKPQCIVHVKPVPWQPGAMGKLDSSDNMYHVFFFLASGCVFWLTVIVTVRPGGIGSCPFIRSFSSAVNRRGHNSPHGPGHICAGTTRPLDRGAYACRRRRYWCRCLRASTGTSM